MTEFNPVSIEAAIKDCYNRIANGVKVCDQRYQAFQEADHAYDIAVAHAMVDLDGPGYLKKFKAELATINERKARDTADAAYRYADRLAKALESELRALQSVGASVRAAYSAAGTGEH